MPKAVVTGDVPIWRKLLDELGDPRPYEPTDVVTTMVLDRSCVDHDDFVDAYDELDEHVRGYELVVDVLQAEARDELDELRDVTLTTIAELFARSSHSLAGVQAMTNESPPLGDATVLTPVSGVLDLLNQSADPTQEFPACPSS